MFDTCFVHIGAEKTGSTSIQTFMQRNRERAREGGFFYPASLGPKGHHNHRWLRNFAANNHDHRGGAVVRRHPGGVEGFRNQLLHEFRQEIQGSTCRTLIVSDEHFQSSLTTLEEIRRLREFLEPSCSAIRIIVYLRRQDELCRSFQSEYIKGGGSDDKPFFEDGISYYYNYRTLIENYEDIFGVGNVMVRIYEKSRLVKGDVIDDFIEVIGLGASDSWQRPARLNVSLSDVALKFLAKFNEIVPVSISDEVNPDRVEIRSVLETHFPGNGWAVSRQWAIDFHERYRDSNEWVRRRFFPQNDTLFTEDFSAYPLTTPDAGISAEDAVQVAVALWRHQAQALRNARSAAAEARSALASARDRAQTP